jgi:putative effector of murein hydrolase
VRLGLYFGLLDEDSATKVSIAFGQLAESYTNFGFVGLALLGVTVGVGFKFVSTLSIGAPQLSTIGLFVILLTAWSFQTEMIAATWLSSLFQAAAVALGIPLGFKILFGS